MRTIKTRLSVLSVSLLAIMATVFVASHSVSANDTVSHNKKTTQSHTEPKKDDHRTGGPYRYEAQAGDSYTLLMRKAIQTYGITNNIKLSPAQIIYAETNATQKLAKTQLDEGEKVVIERSLVRGWVEKAQELSPADQAAWRVYVPFVNFNTDHVGQ